MGTVQRQHGYGAAWGYDPRTGEVSGLGTSLGLKRGWRGMVVALAGRLAIHEALYGERTRSRAGARSRVQRDACFFEESSRPARRRYDERMLTTSDHARLARAELDAIAAALRLSELEQLVVVGRRLLGQDPGRDGALRMHAQVPMTRR